jgi:uncharacterized protein YndB with AHSA1/START domain
MTTGGGRVLRLERRLPVPQATVYNALTEADQLGQWWGPRGFTTPSVDFDPRVGDRYRIAMQPPDGDLFHLLGEFRKVDPPAGLTFTFRWEPPHADDRETLVTLSLLDLGDETEIRLTQGEFATEERFTLHEAGWTESFDRLDEFLRNAT